jgi:hypothetical protein
LDTVGLKELEERLAAQLLDRSGRQIRPSVRRIKIAIASAAEPEGPAAARVPDWIAMALNHDQRRALRLLAAK